MKVAHLDMRTGISGDMFIAAALDAGVSLAKLKKALLKLDLSGYKISSKKVMRKYLSANKINISHKEHDHRHYTDIKKMIQKSGLSSYVKKKSLDAFKRIGEIEARMHGTTIDKVHFHEIGAIDSIIDIVGAFICSEMLDVKWSASQVPLGNGEIEFSHGKWPVPAPATLEILKGVPVEQSNLKAELVTPTGAAILTGLVDSYGPMPKMRVSSIGYGAGTKELETPNVLRLIVGEADEEQSYDEVYVLETEIDDQTAEELAFAREKILDVSLDVSMVSCAMKKGRLGNRLTVVCSDVDKALDRIFEYTTTFGVRIRKEKRAVLERSFSGKYKIGKWKGKVVTKSVEFGKSH